MEKYDYEQAVKDDVVAYINDNFDDLKDMNKDELYEKLSDDLWTEDSVTGNASGSYTFNRQKALENIQGNLPLMVEAFKEFDDVNSLVTYLEDENYEAIDVSIRCYLLGSAIGEALDEFDFE